MIEALRRRHEDYWDRADAAQVGRFRLWIGELASLFLFRR